MTSFIKPTTSSVTYLRGEIIENDPINISLCTSFKKSQLKWYPDNIGIPAIDFHYPQSKITWVYYTEEGRNQQYDQILSTFGEVYNGTKEKD